MTLTRGLLNEKHTSTFGIRPWMYNETIKTALIIWCQGARS